MPYQDSRRMQSSRKPDLVLWLVPLAAILVVGLVLIALILDNAPAGADGRGLMVAIVFGATTLGMLGYGLFILAVVLEEPEAGGNASELEIEVGPVGRAMDRIGDTVKDAIIDFGVPDSAQPQPPVPPPQMERTAFFAAMRRA